MSRRSALIVSAATFLTLLGSCGSSVEPPQEPTTEATAASSSSTPPSSTAPPTSTSMPAPSTTPPPATVASSSTAAPGVVVEVLYSDGELRTPERVEVPLGDLITLTVVADVVDEVHFHGYDLFAAVAPGQPAVIKVEALIPGVFEVELENAGLELVSIEVR